MNNTQEIKLQSLSISDNNDLKSQYYQVSNNQRCQVVLNQFIDKVNQQTNKGYTQLKINVAYGQYVHTHMYIFYVTSNTQQKITICLSIYDFEPGTSHGFIDSIVEGHSQIQNCIKILKQQNKWPDEEAYHLSDQSDINQVSNILSNRIEIINQKIELVEQQYKVIRCWTQTIEGTKYFVHARSLNNFDITALIAISQEQQQQMGDQQYEVNIRCCKGFKNLQQFEQILKQNTKVQ